MLQHRKLVPGIEGNNRLQHRRQIYCLPQHAAPFVEARILVPVEIVDHRIFLGPAAAAGPCRVVDRGLRSGKYRIDGGIVDSGKPFGFVAVFPLPFRICRDRGSDDAGQLHRLGADRANVRRLSQSSNTLGRKRPVRRLRGDPPAGAQHVTSDCQLMGRCANIAGSVMENEIFEMDEFTVDPKRGAGVGELGSFQEACTDRRAGDALVETRKRGTGVESRPHQSCDTDFREIVSH